MTEPLPPPLPGFEYPPVEFFGYPTHPEPALVERALQYDLQPILYRLQIVEQMIAAVSRDEATSPSSRGQLSFARVALDEAQHRLTVLVQGLTPDARTGARRRPSRGHGGKVRGENKHQEHTRWQHAADAIWAINPHLSAKAVASRIAGQLQPAPNASKMPSPNTIRKRIKKR
jgi:hypothetical protein